MAMIKVNASPQLQKRARRLLRLAMPEDHFRYIVWKYEHTYGHIEEDGDGLPTRHFLEFAEMEAADLSRSLGLRDTASLTQTRRPSVKRLWHRLAVCEFADARATQTRGGRTTHQWATIAEEWNATYPDRQMKPASMKRQYIEWRDWWEAAKDRVRTGLSAYLANVQDADARIQAFVAEQLPLLTDSHRPLADIAAEVRQAFEQYNAATGASLAKSGSDLSAPEQDLYRRELLKHVLRAMKDWDRVRSKRETSTEAWLDWLAGIDVMQD